MPKKSLLLAYSNCIINNINTYGLKRYDPSNIRMMDVLNKQGLGYSIIRKFVGLVEVFAPIAIRKILGIEKILAPTAYTHIINAIIVANRNNVDLKVKKNARELLEEYYKNYTKEIMDDIFWIYPENLIQGNAFSNELTKVQNIKTLPMHSLARLGIVIADLYNNNNETELLRRNIKTLETTLKNHNTVILSDATGYISYYQNTKDCTLNVNTEFAQWVTMLPYDVLSSEVITLRDSILRLMIKEQNKNGSWFYLGKVFGNKIGAKENVDCHHTGTVLFNLINIVNLSKEKSVLLNEIKNAVNKGMNFYIENFFCQQTGAAYTYLNKRKAGPVQYSEAIYSFCEYIKSDWADHNTKTKVIGLLPKAMLQCIKLVDLETGRTPSEYLLCRWIEYNSIRWGNGPVLEAIWRYIEVLEKGYLLEE